MRNAVASINQLPTSFQLVESPRAIRRVGQLVLVLLILAVAGLAFLPWQQNSRGSGRVVAYSPNERPQTVESPIYGRVVRFGEGVMEGAHVKKGQMILEIRDIDPARGERLATQVVAVRDKMLIAETKAEAYGRQVVDLGEAREMIIESGRQLVEEARRKIEAEKHGVDAAAAAVAQTRSNFERQKQLRELGLTSGVNFEKDQRSYEEAVAKLNTAKQYVEAAERYLKAKEAELQQKSREGQTKVDYARAMQQEARGEVALATKELSEIEGKQAQFASRVVEAPRDGIILRLMVSDNAEMLKEGDPLFTIVPESSERAVEIWIDGNDVPLVHRGRAVRLQFEGWPAVQFAAGWPSTAYGTFGGRVAAVDAADNGKGKFRVLVRPDSSEPWPDEQLLRQGARANGWILLNEVRLGYEIWRQLNGFPPVFTEADDAEGDKDGGQGAKKKPKLPK